MSELAVGSLKGLAANDFVIDVAAGSTLNVPPPAILQVVSTTLLTNFSTASTSFTAYTGLSASITPSATNSKVLVLYSGLGLNGAGARFDATVFEDGNTIGAPIAESQAGVGDRKNALVVSLLHSPSTTSALTYQGFVRVPSGTGTYSQATLTVMEVAG